MKYYVAGGMAEEVINGERVRAFKLTRPTNGNPYVVPETCHTGLDAATLGISTQHHASLYEISEDRKTLTLIRNGKTRNDPKTFTLDTIHRIYIEKKIHEIENEPGRLTP